MLRFGVLLIAFIPGAVAPCPDDWTQFESHCYAFVDELVPWTSAQTICQILNGHMLEIGSQEENDFVVSRLNSTGGLNNVWIGLQDFLREGRFVWVSNSEVPEYTNWMANEPNNHNTNGDLEGGQDCVWIRGTDGQWDDAWCESTYQHGPKIGVACERRASSGAVIG